MDEESKGDPYSKFVEEFLKENPKKLIFTQVGTVLQDFISAYRLMKEEGDIPNINGGGLKNFKNCLLIAFAERNSENMKSIN